MLRAAVLLLAGCAAARAAQLQVVTPPGSGVHQTSQSEMEIARSLSDAALIRKVEWASSTGAHGEIEPSANWGAFAVPLASRPNQLTVTATDRRGFAIQQSVLVFRSCAPPPVRSFEEGVAEWEGRRICAPVPGDFCRPRRFRHRTLTVDSLSPDDDYPCDSEILIDYIRLFPTP